MARNRGSELEGGSRGAGDESPRARTSPEGHAQRSGEGPPARPGEGTAPVLPESLRRLIAFGLSGVFSTQETLRQTVGDALPKEWVDFAVDQSDRTRAEFLERLAGELARTIESIDLAKVMQQALEGRTLEVHARIRMLPDDQGTGGLKITMTEDDEA